MTNNSRQRYQREHEDGYISNDLLRNPRTIRGDKIVYSAVNLETLHIMSGEFTPSWDSTDHFHFVCDRCGVVADILQVRYVPNYPNVSYALFFYLGCVKCGATGQRKIYLARRSKPARFHETLIGNEILIFGDGREPDKRMRISKLDDVPDDSAETSSQDKGDSSHTSAARS